MTGCPNSQVRKLNTLWDRPRQLVVRRIGLARFEAGERLVDIAYREVLCLRHDVVPGGKVEHRDDQGAREDPARPGGNAPCTSR